jgi:hypothetical protein
MAGGSKRHAVRVINPNPLPIQMRQTSASHFSVNNAKLWLLRE